MDIAIRLRRFAGPLLLIAVAWTPFAFAESQVGKQGQFYIAPGAVVYEGPEGKSLGYNDHDTGPGAIIGYGLSDRWAIEFLWGRTEADFTNPWGSGEDDIDLLWLDAVYKFAPSGGWHPFLLVGGGRSEYGFDGVRPDAKDNQYNLGVGIMRELGERFAIRADVRAVSTEKSDTANGMAFIGLTGYLGKSAAPTPPADSDGDGVPNDRDKCPTTPPGRTVDADGCELDSDGDGVIDYDDQCPNTPKGAPVDRRGCPLDTDGDGVPDYLDECPDTSPGAKVDAKGCYLELEETVTIDMNIEFDLNKDVIRADQEAEVDRAVNFLRQYATANAVIEGHTDSSGSAAYNQQLSERRAKAVYDYMVNDAKIAPERLTWRGYGEDRPIASNDTAEGRQKNRRVSAVVQGKQTVRQ